MFAVFRVSSEDTPDKIPIVKHPALLPEAMSYSWSPITTVSAELLSNTSLLLQRARGVV